MNRPLRTSRTPTLGHTFADRPVGHTRSVVSRGALERLLSWVLAAWFMGMGGVAHAQTAPYTDAQRLLNAGQLVPALELAQRWLAEHPKDPQMRLLQGVIQDRQGQAAAARAIFEALTREYPELPEPYNNLAVLDAAAGRLDAARQALEDAVRRNPAYAVALRNLGDVHVRLAAQAYRQAQQSAVDVPLTHGIPDLNPRLQTLERLLAQP